VLQLQIETIAFCNAKCVFCTYPGMKRKRGRMGAGIYEKILFDAKELEHQIDRVSLQGLGEPLMDREIVERVALAKQALPKAEVSIYTNGSLLIPEMTRKLKDAGLDSLVISLSSIKAEEREASMGLKDFSRVVEWADYARTQIPTKVKLIATRDLIEDMTTSAQTFIDRWGADAMVTWEGNWAGEAWKFRGAPHPKACWRAVSQIMLLWNGDLALCCFDGEGEMTFGNIKEHTLKELWEGTREGIRDLHRSGRRTEIDLCRNCTGI
jgi:radical SAM protein with 4Fe4S-binding SPASM domain